MNSSSNIDWDEIQKKHDAGRYHVEIDYCEPIAVCGYREHSCTYRRDLIKIIYPPNWIERLFGITLPDKIEKGRKEIQRKCDKLNAMLDRCQSVEKHDGKKRTVSL